MHNIQSYLFHRHPRFTEESATPIHIGDVKGRHYYAFAGDVTPPHGGRQVDEAELMEITQHSLLLQQVKREAKRRIEALAPLWTQCNALADVVLLQDKGELTQEETARLNNARRLLSDIAMLRQRSNIIESQLLRGINVDYLTEVAWRNEAGVAEASVEVDTEAEEEII